MKTGWVAVEVEEDEEEEELAEDAKAALPPFIC